MAIALASIVTSEQASATNVTLSYPSGVQAGDLILVTVTVSSNTVLTTPPAGWTHYATSQGGSSSQGPSTAVFFRVAQGGETGAVIFDGSTVAGRITGHISRWTGVDPTSPFDFDYAKGPREFTPSTTTPSVTTTVPGVELVYHIAISSTSTADIETASGTTRFAWTTGTGRRSSLFREARPSAGASTSKTWILTNGATTSLNWGSIVMGLRPAGSGPAPAPTAFRKGSPVVQESASATGVTMYHPAGIAAGELLTAHITHSAPNAPTQNPGGWVLAATRDAAPASPSNSGHPSSAIWYKIATGSESGQVTFPTSGVAGRVTGVMHRWGGIDADNPLDVSPVSSAHDGSFSVITPPPIVTAVNNALIIHHIAINAANEADITAPPEVTKVSGTLGTGRRQSLYTEVKAVAGTAPERTFAVNPATNTIPMHAITLAIRGGTSGSGGDGTGGGTGGGGDGGPVGPQPGTPPTLVQRVVGIPAEPSTNGLVQVKTTGATAVRLKISTDEAGTQNVKYGPSFTPSSLGDARITVSGLNPHTRYYYRIMMTNSSGGEFADTSSNVGRLRTAPVGPKSFAFCFGSCDSNGDPATYATIANRMGTDPSADVGDAFFLMLGDFYYHDGSGTGIDNFRNRFNFRIRGTNHQSLMHKAGTAYCPSDHDGMNNNGAAGSDPTAWANWNTARNELMPQPSNYYSWAWGRVRFILIDTRSYKSNPSNTDNSSKTALGATQKQWFKDQITNATEPVICIVQDGPWIGSADTGDDSWFGFITERTELANFMQNSGKQIFMLAGDSHSVQADDGRNSPGGIAVMHGAPLYTTSSQKGGPYSAGIYPSAGVSGTMQYGRIVVTDTGGTSISVAYQGLDSNNTVRVSMTKTYTAPPAGIANVAAPRMITSMDFPAPTVTTTAAPVGVGAVRAQASSRAYAPEVSSEFAAMIVSPRAAVNGTANPAQVTTGITVSTPRGVVSAQAMPPTVEGVLNSTVNAPVAQVAVAGVAPVVRGFFVGGADVPFAGAWTSAYAPQVVGNVSSTVEIAPALVYVQGSQGNQVEGVVAGQVIAKTATVTARANGALLGAGMLITVTIATASAMALGDDIEVQAGWNVPAVRAQVTAAGIPPTVSVGSTVEAVVAAATANARNPVVSAGVTFVLDPTGPVSVQAHPPVVTGTVVMAAPTATVGAAGIGPSLSYGWNVTPSPAVVSAFAREPFVQATNAVDIDVPLTIILAHANPIGYATDMPIAPVARINVAPGGPIVTAIASLSVPAAQVFAQGGNASGSASVEVFALVAKVTALAKSEAISLTGAVSVDVLAARVWVKANEASIPAIETWPIKWPAGIDLDGFDHTLVDMAERAAAETLRMLTLYRVGGMPITVMPCTNTCARPFTGGQFGNSYVPFYPILLESGAYANCFCNAGCSCESVSTVLLTEPVGRIAVVRINGEVVDPSVYHVDDGNKLVRHDGEAWPSCAGPNFTVTYLNAFEVDPYGEFVGGILAAEYLKLFTTPKECRLPRTVTDVTRGGMTFTVTAAMFPEGMTGINEVDSYLVRWNPNGLRTMPLVISPDVPSQHQTTWRP